MPHATMKKFGYPDSLIHDYEHWCVLLRPAQATLGSLVLICKEDKDAFSKISEPAAAELKRAVSDIEWTLKQTFAYDKINYLMLMMVDPQVHFHVLPRYLSSQHFEGHEFEDPGWPGPPDLKHQNACSNDLRKKLLKAIRSNWGN